MEQIKIMQAANINIAFNHQGPVIQSIVGLTSSLRGRWLVGCFGLNGPLRQYFSLCRAVSLREGERKRSDR